MRERCRGPRTAPAAPGRLPSAAVIRRFLGWWAVLTLEFAVIYAGADFLVGHYPWRWHLYLNSELAVPLVPGMAFFYLSAILIVPLAPFVLRTRAELDALARSIAIEILAAGACFVLVPTELGYAPVASVTGESPWLPWLHFADLVNLDYNAVPSLHVALFVTCAGVYFARLRGFARLALGVWTLATALSTVLTHQHHAIDVLTGAALGYWAVVRALRSTAPLLPFVTNPRTDPEEGQCCP